jgi:hypothetical protein
MKKKQNPWLMSLETLNQTTLMESDENYDLV